MELSKGRRPRVAGERAISWDCLLGKSSQGSGFCEGVAGHRGGEDVVRTEDESGRQGTKLAEASCQ